MSNERGGLGRLLRQLSTEDWVGREVDKYFNSLSPTDPWSARPNPAIKPSSAGDECERSIEISMLGYRTPFTGQSRRRMDNGQDMHVRWQRYLKEAGLLTAWEMPVQNADPEVRGRLDVVLKNPATGKLALGELKSVGSRSYKNLPRGTADRQRNALLLTEWNRPWGGGYVLQFSWYHRYGRVHGAGFDEGFFLFECKDTQEYAVIYVEPSPALAAQALVRPVRAQDALREGRLLDRPYPRDSAVCRRCERERICNLLEDEDETAWEAVTERGITRGG